jgi:hypothetical protein
MKPKKTRPKKRGKPAKAPRTKGKGRYTRPGQPSPYDPKKSVATVLALAAKIQIQKETGKFLELCTMESVALALGVCKDTVNEWQKAHREFSAAIKKWTTARNATLVKMAPTLHPGVFVFMTKNMLGWRDDPLAKKVGAGAGSGDGGAAQKLIIEVVQTKQAPPAADVKVVKTADGGQGR